MEGLGTVSEKSRFKTNNASRNLDLKQIMQAPTVSEHVSYNNS